MKQKIYKGVSIFETMEQHKEDLILGHLTSQMALLPSLSKQYTNKYATRISYLKLKSLAEKFILTGRGERIVLMPGLRGIGKTTLLFQIYEFLKELNPELNIIYLSCDNLVKQFNSNLQEVFEIYEKKILLKSFEELDHKIVFLVDETHYDENWQQTIKNIFDRTKNALIFVSGSCSIAIETNIDLTRRMHLERIYPLNFPEYLLLKKRIYPIRGMTADLKKALFETNNLEESFSQLTFLNQKLIQTLYIKIPSIEIEMTNFIAKGGITSTLELSKEEDIFRKVISVLEKTIYQDIPSFYPSCKKLVNKILPILHVMASATDKISYRKITSLLGDGFSEREVHDLLHALSKAGIIQSIGIGGSPTKTIRNSQKFYFASPVIRAALLWSAGKMNKKSDTFGLLFENAVFNTLNKINIYQPNIIQNISYGKESGTADFKIISGDKKILIESGWGYKSSKQTKKNKEGRFSIVISNINSPKIEKESNTLFIPREMFLLMG